MATKMNRVAGRGHTPPTAGLLPSSAWQLTSGVEDVRVLRMRVIHQRILVLRRHRGDWRGPRGQSQLLPDHRAGSSSPRGEVDHRSDPAALVPLAQRNRQGPMGKRLCLQGNRGRLHPPQPRPRRQGERRRPRQPVLGLPARRSSRTGSIPAASTSSAGSSSGVASNTTVADSGAGGNRCRSSRPSGALHYGAASPRFATAIPAASTSQVFPYQ